MHNNYKIIRTIFENVFQRVLECKDNDTGDTFYSNIITSQKVINLINLEELKKISTNILECYNTEDRIYIYTKPLKSDYRGFREYITNSLTLKQQFRLTESVIDLAQSIFNTTDVVQQKILDIDRLYVDSDNKVVVDLNLIFEQEYDIADNETFKRLGNMIHFIFSGTEIVDYNISDSIPPDILKIIVRCLTREYIFPNDVLAEMKNSPIYSMIFNVDSVGVSVGDNKTTQKITNEISEKQEAPDAYEENAENKYSDDDSAVFDIFVNDNTPQRSKAVKSMFGKKEVIRAGVSILVVVVVLLLGNKLIKMFGGEEAIPGNAQDKTENESVEPSEKPQDGTEADPQISDSTEMYFNDELLKNVGYTGNKVDTDNDIYVEGKNSLVAVNDADGNYKALFAAVDFKDEKFNYMLKKQIGIAAKMKSENDLTAQIVLEAYKDGALTSNFHTSAQIFNDMWSQFTVPINVTDADSLNIYIEFEGKNKIWIDSIFIDVIK